MHHDRPPEPSKAAAAEGIAKKDKRGRPRKRHSFRTVLDRVDELQTLIMDRGIDGFDPAFEAKRGALKGMLAFEEVLYDQETTLLKKADLIPRMVPFFNLLRELAPKGEPKFPSTEKMLDSEIRARATTIRKLGPSASADEILQTLAPAAAQPPEEA